MVPENDRTLSRSARRTFTFNPTFPSAAIAPQQEEVVHLPLFPGVAMPGVGDKPGNRLHQRLADDPQVVRAEQLPVSVTSTIASASRGGLTLSRPKKLHLSLDPLRCQPAAGKFQQLGRDPFPLQVSRRRDGESLGTARTHFTGRRLILL